MYSYGSTHVFGKKLYSVGKALYIRIRFLAKWFLREIHCIPGYMLTFWYGSNFDRKSGAMLKSCQLKSKTGDSFWPPTPFLMAPSWSSSKYFNLQLQTFLATFLMTSYSVWATFTTILCFGFWPLKDWLLSFPSSGRTSSFSFVLSSWFGLSRMVSAWGFSCYLLSFFDCSNFSLPTFSHSSS